MKAAVALIIGIALGASWASLAKAQGFTHVPHGMKDPYPQECCHGRDCSPWPAEDVIPTQEGYFIPSLGAKIGRGRVRPLTREMVQLDIALNGDASPYHLCLRRDATTGGIIMHDGKVTIYCFFAGEGT